MQKLNHSFNVNVKEDVAEYVNKEFQKLIQENSGQNILLGEVKVNTCGDFNFVSMTYTKSC